MQVALTDDVVRGFKCGRIFKDNTQQINSLDFHRTADLLVTASHDDIIYVYDTAQGKRLLTEVPSRKYGAQNVVWTHSTELILFASNKGTDHDVRLLNLMSGGATSRFVTYFKGHTARVTKVAFNPKNDTFITAAQDKEVRLWDVRTPQCQAVLTCPCQATVAYDQQGLVFAVGLDNGIIKLFDAGNYEQGPFETFTVPDLRNSPVPFTHLSFSNDGKLLLGVAEGRAFVLDAFTGSLLRSFPNGVTEAGAAPEASLSYDGQYVLSGCEDKSVRVWNVTTGAQVAAWAGHAGVPHCVKWAPRRLLAASACSAVCVWVPGPEVLQQQIQQQQQQLQQQQQYQQQPQMQVH
ncbi:hypothetical protein OEZ86_007970 [Tetradesmus obliquus]|nr:hypothetical protein OEZ86_007970 [Tetradesmus obliquus]